MIDENERERLEKIAKLLDWFEKQCELCGCRPSYTGIVHFHGNVGMLVQRRRYEMKAEMCGPCLHQQFLKFTAMNIFLGWWGTISLLVTPYYLLRNFDEYGQALFKLLKARRLRP